MVILSKRFLRREAGMMNISTRGRYGLRMILDLAAHKESGIIALKDIAKRQDISKKYLEQIVPIFTKAKIVNTVRGAQGGYTLAGDPESYTVGDILRLTEGDLAPVPCSDQDPVMCERSDDCMTLFIWRGLNKTINDYLDSITLQDVLNNYDESKGDNYII